MINLHNRKFSPVQNSAGGRVKSSTVFTYSQTGADFTAQYEGGGVRDGHIIGKITGGLTAELTYHARAETGALEAGEALAIFEVMPNGGLRMKLKWSWLNGTQTSGTSVYEEIL